MLDYGLIYTWNSHTTHKSNVQWISISFVCLYVFKCDVCMLNRLLIKPKRFFSVFFVFESDFYHLCVLKVFSKSQFFVLKNLVFGSFATHLVSGVSPIKVMRWNEKISFPSQIQAESLATQLQVLCYSNMTHTIDPVQLHMLWVISRVIDLWNVRTDSF